MLAQHGCHVRLAVNGMMPGERIPSCARLPVGELHKLGVEDRPLCAALTVRMRIRSISRHGTSERAGADGGVDTLVSNHAPRRCAELGGELAARGIETTLIGDCLSPRTAEEAVLEGLKAGMAV